MQGCRVLVGLISWSNLPLPSNTKGADIWSLWSLGGLGGFKEPAGSSWCYPKPLKGSRRFPRAVQRERSSNWVQLPLSRAITHGSCALPCRRGSWHEGGSYGRPRGQVSGQQGARSQDVFRSPDPAYRLLGWLIGISVIDSLPNIYNMPHSGDKDNEAGFPPQAKHNLMGRTGEKNLPQQFGGPGATGPPGKASWRRKPLATKDE